MVAKHALQQHQVKVIKANDDEDRQRINIRRSHVVQDSIRAFSKSTFNVSKLLEVVFVGSHQLMKVAHGVSTLLC